MADIYHGTTYVEGARRLRSTLRRAGIDVRDDLKATHKSVSDRVVSRAIQLVPVAPASMTSATPGLLRNSIRAGATQTAAIARAGKKRVPYAGPIHWGWHRRNIKPNLFMTRAAAETEPEWQGIYFEKLKKILDSIEGK